MRRTAVLLIASACAPAPTTATKAPGCTAPGTPEVRVRARRAPASADGIVVVAAADPRAEVGARVIDVLDGALEARALTLQVHSASRFDVTWPRAEERSLTMRWLPEACVYRSTTIDSTP